MMKLDDIIKSEFYTLSTLGGQMLFDKAIKEIEYLKSLKPTIPKYVADWLEGKLKSLLLSELVMLWEEGEIETPHEVQEWFNDKDIVIVLANMEQFGYFVEGDK